MFNQSGQTVGVQVNGGRNRKAEDACRKARDIAKMGLDGADPINMLARIMDLMDPIIYEIDRADSNARMNRESESP